MLRLRLLSASALIAAIAVLAWLDFTAPFNLGRPGIWMIPLGVGFLALAVEEFRTLLAPLSSSLSRLVLHGGTQAILLTTFVPALYLPYPETCPIGRLGFPLTALVAATFFAFVVEMRSYQGPGESTLRVALSTFAFAFLAVPFAFLVLLRTFHGNEWGMVALFGTIFTAKMSDAGAYFAGRFLGRRKLVPLLSPKKTWEGAIGGFAIGGISSSAFFAWIAPALLPEGAASHGELWWPLCLAFGLLIAFAALVGDLAESLIKRDMRAKDSSRRLPGLGGILDVIDSLLAAGPVAFLCFALGLIGPLAGSR